MTEADSVSVTAGSLDGESVTVEGPSRVRLHETPVSPAISSLNKGDRCEYPITPVMRTLPILNGMSAPNAITGAVVAATSTERSSTPTLDRSSTTIAPATPTHVAPGRRWDGTRDTAVDIWLAAFKSRHTRDAYRRNITRWFDWCTLYGIELTDARRGDVDAYRAEMDDQEQPPAPRSIRQYISTISSFYRYWVEEDVLPRNPAAHAARPKVAATPGSIALTLPQSRQLVDYADRLPDIRCTLVVRLLLETGMRVTELCEAQVSSLSVSSGHRTLTIVRKGGVEGVTVLTIRTAQAIDIYLQDRTAGPLLVTASGKPLDRGYVRKLLVRLAREAGLPAEVVERMHPHVLRHTAATLLDEQGIPMQRIQRQLGHADIRQTEVYAGHRQELEASPVYVLGSLLAA